MSAKFSWKPYATGDLIVPETVASCFGGDHDPDDNGQTASGVMTKGNPGVMGCALPMAVSNGHAVPGCFGSPLPLLPYRETIVEVWRSDLGPVVQAPKIRVQLIDVGPDLYLNRGIDLTVAAFLKLGGDIKTGLIKVGYRILDGAEKLSLVTGGAA